MRPAHRLWSGFIGLLLASALRAADVEPYSAIGNALPIDDSALDEIRGGFTTTSGLEIAFGIERVLYINGNLISTTSLNVANAGKLTPALPAAAPTANTNVPTADQLVNAIALPIAAPTTSSATSNSTAGAAAPVHQAVDSSASSLALIQTGAGNIVHSDSLPPASMATIVQNTLNNQKIQNVTVINATVNSMEILKTLNLQSVVNNAINDSVRK